MNETEAIRLCLVHRDPRGFEFLVSAYRREALFHATGLLGDVTDAADACQDCFAKAFASLPRLETLDTFYPWFYRILRNHCLNLLAKGKVRRAHVQDQQTDPAAGLEERSPYHMAEEAEDRQVVITALEEITAEHREILAMKYFQDLRYAEIAETLGIPRGTVMSRLYAARKAFRSAYEAVHSHHPSPEGATHAGL
ncbi:MAG: RNA polymerase sigma factor [Lentisphaerae bacterium]|jgi:RNA polymerase sigma-70 factor, ECF subfamily|nr:RNA polymerase sigma factor [Lentisphaerota bacterium]MBT4814100.1 RNA polymerase sigma factor [Lentisphaerota bacterium]MBT5604574.1 RNA polymerase sigma factor [Lentisphaerota bacterium]MBT7061747.1 RNA polymerase sigma factor [Lentisphaerota bacterium]MBT7848795.1 RNA polymerase sigma factor [Lentisphaerota bacterium]